MREQQQWEKSKSEKTKIMEFEVLDIFWANTH